MLAGPALDNLAAAVIRACRSGLDAEALQCVRELAGALGQLHALRYGRMARNTVQIAKLVDAHPQRDADFFIQLSLSTRRLRLIIRGSLRSFDRTPERLASLVRNHWGIESLHWLRDTVYREDNSTVRTRSGPRVMAGLRNLAVGAHHLAGRRDITEASREAGRVIQRPFKILKLIPT